MEKDGQASNENELCIQVRETGRTDIKTNAEDTYDGRTYNFEEVINAMGPPGRYQILQCVLMSVIYIPCVFIMMSFVFIGLEPSFSCTEVNKTTLLQGFNNVSEESTLYQVSFEDCQIQITSNKSGSFKRLKPIVCEKGYSYNGGKDLSIITEWDLVCESRGIGQMVQSSIALGWFIGITISSIFSDKYGRKRTLIFAVALSSITELGSAFAPNIYVMIGLRFFSGLFASGICSITYILGAEMLVSKHRELFTLYFGFIWSFFSLILCGIGYLFIGESWRHLQVFLALCCMSPLLLIYFVDESASWLYSHGKYERATKIIKRVCRFNGVNFDRIKKVWGRLCTQEMKKLIDQKAAKDYNALDIFRNTKLREYIFISWFTAMSIDLSYFGIYLSASTLSGNMYLNIALMAILEFPGTITSFIMLKYKGRRFVMMFFLAMAAMCLVASTVLGSAATTHTKHIAYTSTAFFLLGRLAIGNCYTVIFLYIPELFPTTLRSAGTGISFTGACLGGMIAPYMVPLHTLIPWAPGTCLIAILTASTLLLLKLPETKGKQLSSIIEIQPPPSEIIS